MISVKHARHNHTCRGQHLPGTFIIETAADSFISLLLQRRKQEFHKLPHQISKKTQFLLLFLMNIMYYAFARWKYFNSFIVSQYFACIFFPFYPLSVSINLQLRHSKLIWHFQLLMVQHFLLVSPWSLCLDHFSWQDLPMLTSFLAKLGRPDQAAWWSMMTLLTGNFDSFGRELFHIHECWRHVFAAVCQNNFVSVLVSVCSISFVNAAIQELDYEAGRH